MTDPQIATRDEWLAARRDLLTVEKELTRQRDRVNEQRRRLPMVEVEADYVFTGPDGEARLVDLFEGRRQLLVQHFMFDPEWDAGCKACSFNADHIAYNQQHLHARDTTWVAVSRAPWPKLEAYRQRMGWPIRWYSSHGSDFNYDFHATMDPSVRPLEYNFAPWPEQPPEPFSMEVPGQSAFLRQGDRVFHTYSGYARGADPLLATYQWLDLTALGRQEGFEQPPGRGNDQDWLRRHDEYDTHGA